MRTRTLARSPRRLLTRAALLLLTASVLTGAAPRHRAAATRPSGVPAPPQAARTPAQPAQTPTPQPAPPKLPPVTLVRPANGATYEAGSKIMIQVDAPDSDDKKVKVKEIRLEVRSPAAAIGEILARLSTAPYTHEWEPQVACHYQLTAHVVYADGNYQTRAAQVRVGKLEQSYETDNGIHVSQGKLHDSRSLAVMLQGVEATLANRNFYDQGSLAAAIGRFQGGRQDTSAFGLNVTGMPIPGVTTTTNTGDTTTVNTGGSTSLNNVLTQGVVQVSPTPGTATTTTTTNTDVTTANQGSTTSTSVVTPNTTTTVVSQPTVTPAAAALPAQTSAFTYQPPYSMASQDLLAEQMSLTYQVLNLRMLLERSLSDRAFTDTASYAPAPGSSVGTQTGVRGQAVVGFQVYLRPQHRHQNAAAEVEITITSHCPTKEPPSLVSMMPRDKTYNVATISKNARQFGLGAVVQVLNIGLSYGRTNEALYLIRDTDTVALERMTPWEKTVVGQRAVARKLGRPAPGSSARTETDASSITFGWQFRPVLGRKAVEGGARDVFAVLSLPNSNAVPYHGTVEVRTRWRKYDAKSGTVGDVIDETINYQQLKNLAVNPLVGDPLKPKIGQIHWEDIGQGQVMVFVLGNNFLSGTSVMAANATHDRAETGLIVHDEQNLRFVTAGQRLARFTDPYVFGRFGGPTQLVNPRVIDDAGLNASDDGWGISLRAAAADGPPNPKVERVDAQNSKVTVALHSKRGKDPVDAKGLKPLAKIGDRVFGLDGAPITITPGADYVELSFVAPTALLRDSGRVAIKYPFWGADFFAEAALKVDESFGVTRASVLASDETSTQIAITGNKFAESDIQVLIGSDTFGKGKAGFTYLGEGLVQISLNKTLRQLQNTKQIIVRQGGKNNIVAFAAPAAPAPKPQVQSAERVAVGDSKTVKLQGANFNSLAEVSFEGQVLRFDVEDEGATLKLHVPSTITASAGEKELTLVLKDDVKVTYKLVVR